MPLRSPPPARAPAAPDRCRRNQQRWCSSGEHRTPHYNQSIAAQSGSARVEERVLHEIISTVGSSLDLEDVLEGVVRLLSDASAVHACFVYLVDRPLNRLVLRAASAPYEQLVGTIELKRGEGLAWWALEHREAAFIRENALADPRVRYVPELHEERFQSLVAIPIVGRRGDEIGTITLDTEAPREFTDAEVELLVSSASLVAGAIENARLYEETRRRVGELEQLTELAEALAAAETLEELGPEVVARTRALLRADTVHLYLLEADVERLQLRFADPAGAPAPETLGLSELGPELGRSHRQPRVGVSLVADNELVGALAAAGTNELDLARAVAGQAAVALKKVQVLERLTEKNLIKDFFEDLAARRLGPGLERRATRLGCDLELPHVVVAAEPADEALERAVAAIGRGTLLDRREEALRAVVRVPPGGLERVLERLRTDGGNATIGVSTIRVGAAALADGFEEARQALLGAAALARGPTVMSYDELGPYRYLLRLALDPSVQDATIDAVSRLSAYDLERGSALVTTLDEFLSRRGSISATSEALFVHPNTLRQRLRRIGEISGIDLRRDDWLTVEIAVKMVRLRATLETAAPDT